MLSNIWEKVTSTVSEGIGWVGDTWAIKTLSGTVRSVLGPVSDLIGAPLSDVLTSIGDIIDSLIKLVLTPIAKAWAPLGTAFASLMDKLRGLGSSIYDGFRKVILVHLPRLRSWAAKLVTAATGAVAATVTGLRRWATGRVSDLWRGVTGLRRWVVDSVLRPLWDRVTGLSRWVTGRVSDLWKGVTGLRRWVVDSVLRPLWGRVTDLAGFVYGRVLVAVRLVETVFTTLQAIARYGPGHLITLLLPGGMGKLAAEFLRAAQGSSIEAVEALDDVTDRLLRL